MAKHPRRKPQPTPGPGPGPKVDPALLAQLAKELRQLLTEGLEIQLSLDAMSAFQLIAQLQLALRHPQNTGPAATTGRLAAEGLAGRLVASPTATPALQHILALGFDPHYDISIEADLEPGPEQKPGPVAHLEHLTTPTPSHPTTRRDALHRAKGGY